MAMDVRTRQFPSYSEFLPLPATYAPVPQYRYASHDADFVGSLAPGPQVNPQPLLHQAPLAPPQPMPPHGHAHAHAHAHALAPGQLSPQVPHPHGHAASQAPLHSHIHHSYPPSPPTYPLMRMPYPSYPREAPSMAGDGSPRMISYASVPFTKLPSPMHQLSSRDSGAIRKGSKRAHNCMVCGKVFARPSALQTHFYSHTGEKPFKCEHAGCGRSFSVVSNLRRHNQKVHDAKRH